MAQKEKWPGFPERLREAFQKSGYWKNGRPDLMGFALRCGFHAGYLYKYVGGDAVPDRERLVSLASALDVHPAWLLFGDTPSLDTPPLKRKSPTKAGGRRGRDERLRQVGGQTAARALHYHAVTAAGGSGRRVA